MQVEIRDVVNIVQCTGQSPTTKNDLAEIANGTPLVQKRENASVERVEAGGLEDFVGTAT